MAGAWFMGPINKYPGHADRPNKTLQHFLLVGDSWDLDWDLGGTRDCYENFSEHPLQIAKTIVRIHTMRADRLYFLNVIESVKLLWVQIKLTSIPFVELLDVIVYQITKFL